MVRMWLQRVALFYSTLVNCTVFHRLYVCVSTTTNIARTSTTINVCANFELWQRQKFCFVFWDQSWLDWMAPLQFTDSTQLQFDRSVEHGLIVCNRLLPHPIRLTVNSSIPVQCRDSTRPTICSRLTIEPYNFPLIGWHFCVCVFRKEYPNKVRVITAAHVSCWISYWPTCPLLSPTTCWMRELIEPRRRRRL